MVYVKSTFKKMEPLEIVVKTFEKYLPRYTFFFTKLQALNAGKIVKWTF